MIQKGLFDLLEELPALRCRTVLSHRESIQLTSVSKLFHGVTGGVSARETEATRESRKAYNLNMLEFDCVTLGKSLLKY